MKLTLSIILSAVTLLACAGCSNKAEIESLRKELQDSKVEINSLQNEIEQLKTDRESLRKQIQEKDELSSERISIAEKLLESKERNNKKIESLLKHCRELNSAALELINAISESDLPDKSERLNDPKIQEVINQVDKYKEDLENVSMENYRLKMEWDRQKSDLPDSLRFSNPKFFKCDSRTDWKIEEH